MADLKVLVLVGGNETYLIPAKMVEDKDFRINRRNRWWSYERWEAVPIGETRSLRDPEGNVDKRGIIGVYDFDCEEHWRRPHEHGIYAKNYQ